jgi:hypothetical protein
MTTRTKPNSDSLDSLSPQSMLKFGAPPFASASVLLGLNALNAQIRIWRTWFDAAHNLVRMQQDAALELARTQLVGRRDAAPDSQDALTQAMESTSHAYESLGAAWLDAQRSAYEALTRTADTRH